MNDLISEQMVEANTLTTSAVEGEPAVEGTDVLFVQLAEDIGGGVEGDVDPTEDSEGSPTIN